MMYFWKELFPSSIEKNDFQVLSWVSSDDAGLF